jgi:hypothetical protein
VYRVPSRRRRRNIRPGILAAPSAQEMSRPPPGRQVSDGQAIKTLCCCQLRGGEQNGGATGLAF